jgi:hypothetical protein
MTQLVIATIADCEQMMNCWVCVLFTCSLLEYNRLVKKQCPRAQQVDVF